MLRNVEIKAAVKNLSELVTKAKELSNSEGEIIKQADTFFKVPEGRLKLRKLENQHSQLIYYNRPDCEGPKLSSYSIASVPNSEELTSVLSQALGIKGCVNKIRHLYLVGQTRVHIDEVEDLGNFMELEVVLRPDQSIEEGQIIANDLMSKLNIDSEHLLSGAYLDHLNN